MPRSGLPVKDSVALPNHSSVSKEMVRFVAQKTKTTSMKTGRSDNAKLTKVQIEIHKLLTSRQSGPLAGTVQAPGDKSISHRALIFGALAEGQTQVTGLLEGEDVLATAEAMRQLGAQVERSPKGTWTITGVGANGFRSPKNPIDFGNSGTGARLIMGAMAAHAITAHLTGDASLCGRPMNRVLDPLQQMGVGFENLSDQPGHLPLKLNGVTPDHGKAITYRLPVASAQVKSALLLAGLNISGTTTVIEPSPTRDHTERMLRQFGVNVEQGVTEDGARTISVTGPARLTGSDIRVPGDPSSAAFPAVAGLIVPGSDLTVTNVMTNPARFGLYQTLQEMGGRITLLNKRAQAGEDVADLRIEASALKAVEVPADRAPSMIDEYPILAMAAACAEGTTKMHGLGELRVKESDRLSAVADGLKACGVEVDEGPDWLSITGNPAQIPGGVTIKSHMDHRIAMAFLVLGLVANAPITVTDADMIATSYPGFMDDMAGLGALLSPTGDTT